MKTEWNSYFDDCPIVAAVKDDEGLAQAAACDSRVVFILYGTVCNISDLVAKVKDAGKTAIVHIDLIAGLSAKEVSVDYIRLNTRADGIISTRPALIRRAQELSLIAIQRFFLIDSIALHNITKQLEMSRPDFIEILPGVMPKIIHRLRTSINTPVIAGGLVSDKEDVMAALGAGAVAVSTTNQSIWVM